MGGVAFSSIDQCFKQALLKKMFESEIPLTIEFSTQFFVTVDPAAGGENSDFALVSFTVSCGVYKVCISVLLSVASTVVFTQACERAPPPGPRRDQGSMGPLRAPYTNLKDS